MYGMIGCLLFLALFSFSFFFFRLRAKKACKRLCGMSCEEKLCVVSPLLEAFGYCYEPSQDIFSTTVHAPQRRFGYTALYDRYAPRFGMVYDCMPVYFDYGGRTWLIQLWKGQYGINLGCEAGIYQADSLVAGLQRKTTLFQSVEDEELMRISLCLFYRGEALSRICGRHWWQTIFHMGMCAEPRELSVRAAFTFPNEEMLRAFADALSEQEEVRFQIRGRCIEILYSRCDSCSLSFPRRLIRRVVQWKNRILCKLFLRITGPFQTSLDRLLFLYYCVPGVFRRVFHRGRTERCCSACARRCRRRRGPSCHKSGHAKRCQRSCRRRKGLFSRGRERRHESGV